MELPYFKEIFDPIYGFIRLTKDEISIIDSLIFQRLHNINQLGLLHLVFPTARNTRFSHSLGVLAVTEKIIENLKYFPINNSDSFNKFEIPPKYQKLIRTAALLHDIGHLPFSHCTEDIIKKYIINNNKIEIKTSKLHEWLSSQIVKKTEIYNPKDQDISVIKDDRENISQIILGSSSFLLFNQILHFELDADRIDYINRDSYSLGVSFGHIDIDQILRRMFVKERRSSGKLFSDNIILYSTKAINAIDSFYFSRMSMFNSVYFHKTKIYFEFLLAKSYDLMINSKNLKKIQYFLPLKPDYFISPLLTDDVLSGETLKDFYEKWSSFDDYYLWNCMRNCWYKLKKFNDQDLNDDLKLLKLYLNLLFQRKTSTLIWELNRLKHIVEEKSPNNNILDSELESILNNLEVWIINVLSKEFNCPFIVSNNKIEAPLENKKKNDPKDANEYDGRDILFYNQNSHSFHFLCNVESSINYQSNTSCFHIFRVFSPIKIDEKQSHQEIQNYYENLIKTAKDQKNHIKQ